MTYIFQKYINFAENAHKTKNKMNKISENTYPGQILRRFDISSDARIVRVHAAKHDIR